MKYYNQARHILINNLTKILEKHEMEHDNSTAAEVTSFLNWSTPQSVYYGKSHSSLTWCY